MAPPKKQAFPLGPEDCDAILAKIKNRTQTAHEEATLMASIYCDFLHELFSDHNTARGKTPTAGEMACGTDLWVVKVQEGRRRKDFLFCAILLHRHMLAISKRVASWLRDLGIVEAAAKDTEAAKDDRVLLYQYLLFRYGIATGEDLGGDVEKVEERLRRADRTFMEYDFANLAFGNAQL